MPLPPILAVSLHQPYPTLIALGLKRFETRSWKTNYRGPIAICSALKWDKEAQAGSNFFAGLFCRELTRRDHNRGERVSFEHVRSLFLESPRGFVICLANLVECAEMTPDLIVTVGDRERAVGGWEPGRFAWRLENVQPLAEPVPIKGQQGLWTLSASEATKVRAGVGA
jgi:hypothetical protein